MDLTFRNHINKIFLFILISNMFYITQGTGSSLISNSYPENKLVINQEFDIDIGNLTQDLLQVIAEAFYKGDGSGIIEIIWNLIPIVGTNGDALLYPVFLLLMSSGVMLMLKKQGYID